MTAHEITNKKVCEKTKYYFNFSIEEYEMLMYLLEQGHDIFSLLSDYYDNERLKPFSNYLQENYSEIGRTIFMEKLYQEAAGRMKDLLFQK